LTRVCDRRKKKGERTIPVIEESVDRGEICLG